MSKTLVMALALGLSSLAPAMAADGPKVYGKVNVEYAQVSQDDKYKNDYRKSAGANNVENSESRLGAKGSYDIDGNEVKYVVELGLNSTKHSNSTSTSGASSSNQYGNNSGRIRIRQAHVSMGGNWGKLTLGQDYTASSKMWLKLDPLSDTWLGLQALDAKAYIANAVSSVGYKYRSRADQVKYNTPTWNGLSFAVSVDREDDPSNKVNAAQDGATYYTQVLSYKKEMGSTNLQVHLGNESWSDGTATEKENNKFLAIGADMDNGLGLALTYSMENEETPKTAPTPTFKTEIKRMMAAVKYRTGKHQVAFTYGKRDDEKSGDTAGSNRALGYEDMNYSQLALGYKHHCSKKVQLKFGLGQYKTEENNPGTAATVDNSNETLVVSTGLQVKF